MKNVIKNFHEEIQILKNVKITYYDGFTDNFNTAILTKKGLFFGQFKNDKKFVEAGFIPRFNIVEIEGEIIKKIYKRIF